MNNYIQRKPIGESNGAPIGLTDSVNGIYNSQNAQTPGEKLVVFFLCGRLYGVSAREVAEVSQPVPIAALPSAPEWLLGIGNLRGEIIAVANLPEIICENSQASMEKTKLIVLKTKKYDTAIAFPVDKLSEIIASKDAKLEAASGTDSPYVYAELTYQSNVIRLIDCDKLLNSLAAI